MEAQNEEIKNLSQKIIQSLETKSTDGISTYQSILLSEEPRSLTYNDYLERLEGTLKKCTCQNSWTTDKLIIECLDCQKNANSCICVDCFLKGNHKGHRITISHCESGCCDCGDPIQWSRSGFCCDHSGSEPHPDQTQLEVKTKVKLVSISMSAIHFMIKYASTNKEYFINIINFLTEIASLGDATKRCVSIAIQNSIEFIDIFKNCQNFYASEYGTIHEFFSLLSSDDVFRTHFTVSILRDFPELIRINQKVASEFNNPEKPPVYSVTKFFVIVDYILNTPMIRQLIFDSKIDWFNILNESYHLVVKFNSSHMSISYNKCSSRYFTVLDLYRLFKHAFAVHGNKDEKIIKIVEILFELILENEELRFPFTRIFGDKSNNADNVQLAFFEINFDHYLFINRIIKGEIFTTKPLSSLKKLFESEKFLSIDKDVNDSQPYFHSVLSRNVEIYQSFVSHIYAFYCLNLKEKKLIDYITEVSNDVDLFIKNWALLPLRWISSSILYGFKFFIRNPYDVSTCFSSLKFRINVKYSFIQIFTFLQTLLKATKDTESFLLMIISVFNTTVIENKENDEFDDRQKQYILFSIFHFISCLIFDNICAERNKFIIHRFKIISALMNQNMSLNDIDAIWYKKVSSDDKSFDDLKSYTTRETTNDGTMFHLSDDSSWHPLLPFIELFDIIPLIQKFISKNPDSLINFPNIPNGNEYLLFSPTLWALEYSILNNKSCKNYTIIHQLLFNVLIATSNESESFYKEKKINNENDDLDIHAINFNDLIQKLKNLSFNQFMQKKIIFNNDDGKSMIDMISGLGNIGITVLKRMNIPFNKSSQLKEELQKKNKERANKVKMQMMNHFIQRQKSFQSSSLNFEEANEKVQKIECGICHVDNETDCFVYPALVYKSPLSSYIKWHFRNAKLINSNDHLDQAEFEFNSIPDNFELFNSVRICLHPIHSSCIKRTNYQCPADRCWRNSKLPIIEGIFDFNTITSKPLFYEVLRFVEKTYDNSIKIAVFSLASEIEILEMRHRMNPNCLDNPTIVPMLRNIYLCIWHLFNGKTLKILSEEEENEEEQKIHLSPLMKYILFSMNLDSSSSHNSLEMNKFINDYKFKFEKNDDEEANNDLYSDYQKFQFLRCAAIFDHFARNINITQTKTSQKENEFIDWDEYLEQSFLFNYYNIQIKERKNETMIGNEMILPMLSLYEVPFNYLDFIHPPYSLPILSEEKGKLSMCLLTGKIVKVNNIKSYLEKEFNNSFSIFLFLNGKSTSEVSVMYIVNNKLKEKSFKSFFFNKFGDTDVGIKNGHLLFLSKSKREEIIDNFLSGSWTNYITF